MTIQVSVVVPTYKRPDCLQRCLDALLAQTLDAAAYEVIVADNAASVDTRLLVLRAAARGTGQTPLLRYVAVGKKKGPAAARNQGWRMAQADIIAFTDDDCIPQPDWLREGMAHFGNGNLGVAGKVEVPLPPAPTDSDLNTAGLQGIQFLTANCFYRRDQLEAVGGFDERFTEAWREDSDLFFTLLERHDGDQHFAHAPEAVVVHPVRPAAWGSSLKQQRKSMFNALLYKKHPSLYRALIQASPPWHYYRIVAALLATLAGWAMGRKGVMVLGAAAWSFLTARFCVHRLHRTTRTPSHITEMVVTSALIPPLSLFWRLVGAVRYRVMFL